jgi:hypothetical protein
MGTQASKNTFVSGSVRNVHVFYPSRNFWRSLALRMGIGFSEYDGSGPVSGGGQKVNVEPGEIIEIKVPENVYEIILVEDCFVGQVKKRAFYNGTTLWFFAAMFVIMMIAEFVSNVIWN